MKLHFEPDLDYQRQAIESVCDLFQGQELCRTEFTVSKPLASPTGGVQEELFVKSLVTSPNVDANGQGQLFQARYDLASSTTSDLGVGNRLTLLDHEVLANLSKVQIRHGLPPSESLASGDFTVEMETGTGKTYVYLRTIFELNKRYGFTKFVIVVPSVAIKEGVYKSLQITEDHFKGLYAGAPFDYFLYDSAKLGQVRNFATSAHIQIMVVTVGAINKKEVNNLYKDSEKVGGEKPIDLIRATRPIIIVDEPQSVDGPLEKGEGKKALDGMNPLCTLRYSATHVQKHHMVYRLDAVDAYEQKLVKQIEVAAATVEDAHNRPYVKLVEVKSSKKSGISATIEVDVESHQGVQRIPVTGALDGDDLQQTTRRAVYANVRIGDLKAGKNNQSMVLSIPGDEIVLKPGQSWGGVDAGSFQRELIRRTIREHFEKEKRLRPQGIKVLSLFFIDEVAKYRSYDASGRPMPGEYAHMFEEEFKRLARLPDYQAIFTGQDVAAAARDAHDGYFSIDKKGGWTNTDDGNASGRESAERAYNLIMKDKERLLALTTPLRFIFSHSALREGWDNPNVFQICTLREMGSERQRRQTLGRGLRLCVNQEGLRIRGHDINTLTVIATESYEQFAKGLQSELEDPVTGIGIRFGMVESHQFAAIPVTATNGSVTPLGLDVSKSIVEHLKTIGYLDRSGRVQDSLRTALKSGKLDLPPEAAAHADQVATILKKLAGSLDIKNANERKSIRTRQAVLESEAFKALWDRIKHKSTYRVHFDNDKLIADCTKALQEAPAIPKARLQWRKADVPIGRSGVHAKEKEGAQTITIDESAIELPDILTELQDRTQLTRRSIAKILIDSGRLSDFQRNPQAFIAQADEAINRCKRLAIVEGIKYQRIGDIYAQELFQSQELTGYLKNLLETGPNKSVYEHVVYDSDIERDFAKELENNLAIKVYAKLPGWFTIPTPLGSYNPDWAILVEEDGAERLYFVVETKSTINLKDLRNAEAAKIACGEAHFRDTRVGEVGVRYRVAKTLSQVSA
jgi:type III restriction enzyme